MTILDGPPYPEVVPGSNAIGEFTIGVSPIGDIPPFNFWDTIISQYANSAILTQLIANMDAYLDQTENFDNFFDDIWNIDTAQGYGLDLWGRILGVTRYVTVGTGGTNFFGFQEADDPGIQPFGQAPFYAGPGGAGQAVALSDSDYRTLLFAKALSNISNGSIPAINQLLINLFPGRGNAYVTDGLNMTMTYTFMFALTSVELAIVTQSGVLPKPTGVSATIVQP